MEYTLTDIHFAIMCAVASIAIIFVFYYGMRTSEKIKKYPRTIVMCTRINCKYNDKGVCTKKMLSMVHTQYKGISNSKCIDFEEVKKDG